MCWLRFFGLVLSFAHLPRAKLLGVRRLHWQVHNRWGTLLYSDEATTVEDAISYLEIWDGQVPGGPASNGSYMLTLHAQGAGSRVEHMQVVVQVSGSR